MEHLSWLCLTSLSLERAVNNGFTLSHLCVYFSLLDHQESHHFMSPFCWPQPIHVAEICRLHEHIYRIYRTYWLDKYIFEGRTTSILYGQALTDTETCSAFSAPRPLQECPDARNAGLNMDQIRCAQQNMSQNNLISSNEIQSKRFRSLCSWKQCMKFSAFTMFTLHKKKNTISSPAKLRQSHRYSLLRWWPSQPQGDYVDHPVDPEATTSSGQKNMVTWNWFWTIFSCPIDA